MLRLRDFSTLEAPSEELQRQVVDELKGMPALDNLKDYLQTLMKKAQYVEQGGDPRALHSCLNLVLTGNPGTGKTTCARLIFRFLLAHSILKRNVFVERNALQLKAIRMLLTEVENNRTGVMVVLAGYKDKMQKLMTADPGMQRRFPQAIHLPDYDADQLAEIAVQVAKERYGARFEDGLQAKLAQYMRDQLRAEIPRENAALAVKLVDQAMQMYALSICAEPELAATLSRTDAVGIVLTEQHFKLNETTVEGKLAEQRKVVEEIDALIGMASLKEYVRRIRKTVEYVDQGGDPKVLQGCLNLVLTGNPGTGKTTSARKIFRFLLAHGVLKKDLFTEINALSLKGEYLGQTAPKVQSAIREPLGGCLFLDEAYALTAEGGRNNDSFSNEAIRTLLTEVENNRTGLMVVLAGYSDKMERFFAADPGLPRRFPQTLHLEDYSPAELARIAEKVAREQFKASFEDGLEEKLATHFASIPSAVIHSQNGGLAVNCVERAMQRLAERLVAAGTVKADAKLLLAADFMIGPAEPAGSRRADAGHENRSKRGWFRRSWPGTKES